MPTASTTCALTSSAAPARARTRPLQHARQLWREAEEFNVNASLALEALFVRLHGVLA